MLFKNLNNLNALLNGLYIPIKQIWLTILILTKLRCVEFLFLNVMLGWNFFLIYLRYQVVYKIIYKNKCLLRVRPKFYYLSTDFRTICYCSDKIMFVGLIKICYLRENLINNFYLDLIYDFWLVNSY